MLKFNFKSQIKNPMHWVEHDGNHIHLEINEDSTLVIDDNFDIIRSFKTVFKNCIRTCYLISGNIKYSDIVDLYPDGSKVYAYIVTKEFTTELNYTFDCVILTEKEFNSSNSLYNPYFWKLINKLSEDTFFKILSVKDEYEYLFKSVDTNTGFTYSYPDVSFDLDISSFGIIDCKVSKDSLALKCNINKMFETETKQELKFNNGLTTIWLKFNFNSLIEQMSNKEEKINKTKTIPIELLQNENDLPADMVSYNNPALELLFTIDIQEI